MRKWERVSSLLATGHSVFVEVENGVSIDDAAVQLYERIMGAAPGTQAGRELHGIWVGTRRWGCWGGATEIRFNPKVG